MISRIYVVPVHNASRIDSYVIDSKFSRKELEELARSLTNPILENYFIDKSLVLPEDGLRGKLNYAVEIGFKPGVTDNVAGTVKEIAKDMFKLKNESELAVYTSKIFLISGSREKAQKFATDSHNPLIERAVVVPVKKIPTLTSRGSLTTVEINLPNKVPKVIIKKKKLVENISLDISDAELVKIGKEGILDQDGARRGPLALSLASMKAIKEYFKKLKRNPTDIELESLAQTWSEHCKHTIFANPIDDIKDGLYKTYIKGATNEIRKKKGKKDFCISVFSDNAGGIIFDENYLITHKVETHNSPSALDPFGGALTGIVGVNRDTLGFGLGAKPVANTYGFCFGDPSDTRALYRDKSLKQRMLPPARIMDGVIKGINVGGNCSGIPTLSGFIKFDERYRGKPLVFAGTVGLIPRKIGKKLSHEKSARLDDLVVVVGGRVGLDGIHGATFSSVSMDSNSPATAVQIGDPITQKKLSDALVKEARDLNLYNSITDNGAGGISCSVAEMAKECGGVEVDLEKVPLKYPGLSPWEIWISESQERMTLAVPKNKWKGFDKLMQSRGIEAKVIGKFTNSGKVIVRWKNKKIMDIDMEFLHNGLPKEHLKTSPPAPLLIKERVAQDSFKSNKVYTKTLENLLAEKNIRGFSFISEQYDHEVQASSVLKPLSGRGRINTDAQVFKPVLSSNRAVVLSAGVYPSYGDINTYHMASCALDTAVKNAICAGGTLKHLAILDNFCWCSSDDPKRLGQLVDSVKACYDNAVGYSTPFISGKDSMFNDFKGYDERGNSVAISIPPTLLISAISVMKDFSKTVSPEFKNVGDIIYLLGETNNELGASEYYKYLGVIRNNSAPEQARYGASVPKVNQEKNLKTYLALEKVIQKELVNSAIPVNSGGLGITLAKACIGGMLGCKVSTNPIGLSYGVDVKLFSESQGRVLVSVSPKNVTGFEKLIKNIPHAKLGRVNKGDGIIITDSKKKVIETNVKKLYNIYHKFSESQK